MAVPTVFTKLKQHPIIKASYRVSQEIETPIYLVGGAVRDALMGIAPEKDFDFVLPDNLVNATRLFAQIFSGSFFPISVDPPNFRVVLFHQDQRIEVDFSGLRGANLEKDLADRDFTVNAMALEVSALWGAEARVFDPLGGARDLKSKVLRMASPRAFEQDPLRLLRAVRIAKERDLEIDLQTREEIYRQRELLGRVSIERIRSEFFKILQFPRTRESLCRLDELGLLSLLIPETEALKQKCPPAQTLWHGALERVSQCEWALEHGEELFPGFQKDVARHFAEEIEQEVRRDNLFKLAGFLADLEQVFPANQGLSAVKKIATRLKLGRRTGRILQNVIHCYRCFSNLAENPETNPRIFFRFFEDVGTEGFEVMLLGWADVASRHPERGPQEDTVRKFMATLAKFYCHDYPHTKPLLSGHEVIERFGLQEGKTVGEVLHQVALAEAQGNLCSPEDALAYVEDFLNQKRNVSS